MNNNANIDQFAAAQKAGAEVMMTLMRTAFEGMQRLADLNMALTRDVFSAGVANAQQMMSAKTPEDLVKLNASFSPPNLDKMVDYSRGVYDLVAEMQKNLTSVIEQQFGSLSTQAAAAIDQTKAGAPIGGDVFAAAMKSMLDATTQSFENMTLMAKQIADVAESNVGAATQAASSAIKATRPAKPAAGKGK